MPDILFWAPSWPKPKPGMYKKVCWVCGGTFRKQAMLETHLRGECGDVAIREMLIEQKIHLEMMKEEGERKGDANKGKES